MPLITLLALHITKASANGIHYQRSHIALHFDHLDQRNANAVGSLVMLNIVKN